MLMGDMLGQDRSTTGPVALWTYDENIPRTIRCVCRKGQMKFNFSSDCMKCGGKGFTFDPDEKMGLNPRIVLTNTYDEFEIDAKFGQRSLGWPAPSDGNAYSVEEIYNHAKKHTRKFTQGLLAAVILTIHITPAVSQQLAKYFGVDVKKLRQKAVAAAKEEDAAAKLKAKGQGPKASASKAGARP